MPVVLITGCSSGIGFAAAEAFARSGDTVFAAMRDAGTAGPLRDAAAAQRLDIRMLALDVTQPVGFAACIQNIVRDTGRLDVLVNNAGVIRPGAFEDLTEASLREVMETNFFGPMLLSRAVLPQMRRQRSGYIIMVSSLSGLAGLPGDAAYSASKFALEGATEALRHEVDRWNIKLALVEAALHATRLFAASRKPDSPLPRDYPANSPYRALVEHQLRGLRARLPQALDPSAIGELLVRIARSDGRQLRWPADAVATQVLSTLLAQDDAARDRFLRGVSGIDWWSEGRDAPS